MEKCREEDLEVLFVISPFRITKDEQKKVNYMKRIVEEQGVRFLDCNRCVDDIGIDYDMDFYNRNHVNSIGAEKFSRYLGEYILENYDIDAAHSPEVTASWDKAAEENRALYEEACEQIRKTAQEQLITINARKQAQSEAAGDEG